MPWRRKWLPTPVFLPGESHGGLQSTGSQRAGHNWVTKRLLPFRFLLFNYLLPREGQNTGLAFLLLFSCSVMCSSLRPHGLQHARLLCPSPSPGVCSSSCPLIGWGHPTTSSLPSWLASFMNRDCHRRITFSIAKPQRISAPGVSVSAGQGCSWHSSQQRRSGRLGRGQPRPAHPLGLAEAMLPMLVPASVSGSLFLTSRATKCCPGTRQRSRGGKWSWRTASGALVYVQSGRKWEWKSLSRVRLFATPWIQGVLQARILEWAAFPFSRDLPNPGIKPRSLALQADSLPAGPQEKPICVRKYSLKIMFLKCFEIYLKCWSVKN